ncbi:Protein of unknown function [Marivirga sericea]|uniref:DUF2806 domain-containing protein n=1 Tax=Marivirga sericea TaxID=1028 RepID=A0A1X7L7F0_9BACT|nr:DUF2806 domain-containing protein [Marivirga sericea]SMG49162.1 Protein of unknown function [Marivirga sericea]
MYEIIATQGKRTDKATIHTLNVMGNKIRGDMSQEESSKEPQNSELSSVEAEDILSYIDGIPLPPAIKKSLWKSLGRLITGLVDVPVAYLEAKVQKIKSEADGLSLVTSEAAKSASKEFGVDRELVNRSVNFFGAKLLREQINRESIMEQATEDLKNDPPKEDSKEEIDEDWLEMFSRIAETKSSKDVQLFLSKILAGEIRKPGSFGAKTIQTLSTLDQRTAQQFMKFCNVSFELPQLGNSMTCVISEPFGNPASNGLQTLGLSYDVLTQLQDAGLVKHDFTSYRTLPPLMFSMPHVIGTTKLSFKPTALTPRETVRIKVLNFTSVGLELSQVLHKSSNPVYVEKYSTWIKDKFKLE